MGEFLGESQSRIYPHMRAKIWLRSDGRVEKGGGGGFMIMTLLQACQVQLWDPSCDRSHSN